MLAPRLQKRKVDPDEAKQYAEENNIMFMETSAKTAANVNELFVQIGESIGHCPYSFWGRAVHASVAVAEAEGGVRGALIDAARVVSTPFAARGGSHKWVATCSRRTVLARAPLWPHRPGLCPPAWR